MGHPEARPGHYSEDPYAGTPRVRIFEPFTWGKIVFIYVPVTLFLLSHIPH